VGVQAGLIAVPLSLGWWYDPISNLDSASSKPLIGIEVDLSILGGIVYLPNAESKGGFEITFGPPSDGAVGAVFSWTDTFH
jgi:hypothetical protein